MRPGFDSNRSCRARAAIVLFLLWVGGAGGLGGCARPVLIDSTDAIGAPECTPSFPDQQGWYGGDAAYSVPLPGGAQHRSLWLFGDSFVDRSAEIPGREFPFIHNSIGLSRCERDTGFRIHFYWDHAGPDAPRAFFEPDPRASWVRQSQQETAAAPYYWPFDGFVSRGTLYVSLLRVREAAPRGPFRLPFELIGVDLARIENPQDEPPHWRISITTLSNDRSAFPGSAFAVDGDMLYAFGFLDRPDARTPRILLRLPLSRLDAWPDDLTSQLETWTESGDWIPGVDATRARVVMDDDASEMSVHFDPVRGAWLAVYNDPTPETAQPDTEQIWLRRAQQLTGPWSAPEAFAPIPETRRRPDAQDDPVHPADANTFCYAGKAHPQYASKASLVVTYVCSLYARTPAESSEVLSRLRERTDLYRPQVLRVPIPER